MEVKYDVPVCVIQGLEDVRQGSKYNMWSGNEVLRELFELGHYEAVTWLVKEDHIDHCTNCQYGEECDNCHHNQVKLDNKKYVAALHELGQILSLPDILAGEKNV